MKVIWRNPLPPLRRQFQVRRVELGFPGTTYEVSNPYFLKVFELRRGRAA